MITPQRIARTLAIHRRWAEISKAVDAKILEDHLAGRPAASYVSADEDVVDIIYARYAAIGWDVEKKWTGKDRAHEAYDEWTLVFEVPESIIAAETEARK